MPEPGPDREDFSDISSVYNFLVYEILKHLAGRTGLYSTCHPNRIKCDTVYSRLLPSANGLKINTLTIDMLDESRPTTKYIPNHIYRLKPYT